MIPKLDNIKYKLIFYFLFFNIRYIKLYFIIQTVYKIMYCINILRINFFDKE